MNGRRMALSRVLFTTVSPVMSPPSSGEMKQKAGDAAGMELHHLHILLNQGISMAA